MRQVPVYVPTLFVLLFALAVFFIGVSTIPQASTASPQGAVDLSQPVTMSNVRLASFSTGKVWLTIYPRGAATGFGSAFVEPPRRITIYEAMPNDVEVCFANTYEDESVTRCRALGDLRTLP